MEVVIILGSARKDGEAEKLAKTLAHESGWDLVNLLDYNISQYDYEHLNRNDDFIPLMERIIGNYQTLVFVSLVYWYSMSGIMKMFFDRITDLLTIEKDLGRNLRGKKMAAISSSYGDNLEEQFWLPFQRSAEYLGMYFKASLHTKAGALEEEEILKFIEQIKQ